MAERPKGLPVRTVKELLDHAEKVRQSSAELVQKMKKLADELRKGHTSDMDR